MKNNISTVICASTCRMHFVHLKVKTISDHTYSGFPVTEQVRLSESPSRKMPVGGVILTVGATVGRKRETGQWMVQVLWKIKKRVHTFATSQQLEWHRVRTKKKKIGKSRKQCGRNESLQHLFPRQLASNRTVKTGYHEHPSSPAAVCTKLTSPEWWETKSAVTVGHYWQLSDCSTESGNTDEY